ncbi:MAG: metal-sensitive transcriptional regulator [Marmoricola sp.]
MSDQRQVIETRPGWSATTSDVAPVTSPSCAVGPRPMMDPERRDEVLLRLAKAAGQVQGVARMVGDGRYCVDVLTQITAAQKALDGAARVITRNYLERCVSDAIANGDPLIYDEVMKVLDRRR